MPAGPHILDQRSGWANTVRSADRGSGAGAQYSLKHWHSAQDELIYVLEGVTTLVESVTKTVLRAGDTSAFKAGGAVGHHLRDCSDRPSRGLVVNTRACRRDYLSRPLGSPIQTRSSPPSGAGTNPRDSSATYGSSCAVASANVRLQTVIKGVKSARLDCREVRFLAPDRFEGEVGIEPSGC
ncbi:cupin domain-containing protein [Mesorhizobium ephedrae]|uniref:cupin domain-containing protein n=1 Tax=Kumtagia ephedrae TaxID=2116701 RepID=UPI001A9CAAAF